MPRLCRHRNKVFELATRPGLSPANIRAAIEDSLGRLKTDYVDIYFAHHDDAAVPQADYLEAFDTLVREGKVQEVGASNFSIERLVSANAIAKESVDGIAAAHSASPASVSVAWLRQQQEVGAPIASARTTAQLDVLIESFDLELTAAELQSLCDLPTKSSAAPYFMGLASKH